jgi:hypothetical protein
MRGGRSAQLGFVPMIAHEDGITAFDEQRA